MITGSWILNLKITPKRALSIPIELTIVVIIPCHCHQNPCYCVSKELFVESSDEKYWPNLKMVQLGKTWARSTIVASIWSYWDINVAMFLEGTGRKISSLFLLSHCRIPCLYKVPTHIYCPKLALHDAPPVHFTPPLAVFSAGLAIQLSSSPLRGKTPQRITGIMEPKR